VIVVVDGNQVAELKVTGHGGGLGGDTLHGAAITKEGVSVVVEQLKAGLVEDTTGVGLGDGETNSVGETLAERTSGDLNTGGVVGLGVTGGDTAELLVGIKSVRGDQSTKGGQCFAIELTRKDFRSSMVRA
jgi:hypothetical protein